MHAGDSGLQAKTPASSATPQQTDETRLPTRSRSIGKLLALSEPDAVLGTTAGDQN